MGERKQILNLVPVTINSITVVISDTCIITSLQFLPFLSPLLFLASSTLIEPKLIAFKTATIAASNQASSFSISLSSGILYQLEIFHQAKLKCYLSRDVNGAILHYDYFFTRASQQRDTAISHPMQRE